MHRAAQCALDKRRASVHAGINIAAQSGKIVRYAQGLAVPLISIAYASSASTKPSADELRILREEWFDLCSNAGITGLILYRDGNFVGYLEGETDPLTRVFAAIRLDRRHHLVTVVWNEPCERREFDTWSMSDSLPVEATRREPVALRLGYDLLRAMWGATWVNSQGRA